MVIHKRDTSNARLVRANLGVRRVIVSWGARPSWSICAVFVIMYAVMSRAPDDENREVIQRYTIAQMKAKQRPQYIIQQLWAIERFGAHVGW